eukprot:m.569026 g.569026  ORF g.569026 m.569026 type:complete len:75 (-) comp57839_c0_seq23:71-295(-)
MHFNERNLTAPTGPVIILSPCIKKSAEQLIQANLVAQSAEREQIVRNTTDQSPRLSLSPCLAPAFAKAERAADD